MRKGEQKEIDSSSAGDEDKKQGLVIAMNTIHGQGVKRNNSVLISGFKSMDVISKFKRKQ